MAFEIRKSQEKESGEMVLTREEREALLDQKIQRMKIKNAERMKKFQEIEEDKKWAEREGRAVTLKHRDFSDNEDESWPKRADRFEDVDEVSYQQADLRKVLQNRKNETKVVQEPQPDSGRRQNTSKYKSIVADGPPPDPAYNYLADRDRDAYFAEKREDNKYRRGFQRQTRGEQRQNQQSSASHQGHSRSQRPFDESGNDESRENYNHWRKEREHIDRDRIQRQKTKEGWKREWDCNKHENQNDDSQPHESVVPQNLDVLQKNFGNSGESHFRGTASRGGRGRGRLRPDMRFGSTPGQEIGTNYQKSSRFRNSPDDQQSGNMMKQESEQGSAGVGSHSVGPSDVNTMSHNLHREPVRSRVMLLPDVVNPTVKNYNAKGSIVITVGNQGCDGNGEEATRTIQSKDTDVPGRLLDLKTKTEFLTHAQFSKSPKKGIGSGRIIPPQKGRPVTRGKDASRRMAVPKGRRFGSRNSTGESESEVTIGIAVITTPGDKEELTTEGNYIIKGAENVNFIDISVKKELESPDNEAKSMDLLDGELEEDDDDDDEWEDVEEGSVEIDDNLKQELNKSNESIHRFIEENTLHPDGTNWNIDVDGDVIPWSEQVDAESQERHRRENEYLRPSDSFVDTSFQSSCSIVESPFEQSEILSSLLAAACDSPAGPCIGPCTSASDGTKPYTEYEVDGNIAMHKNLSANSDKKDGADLQESLQPNRMLSNSQVQASMVSETTGTHKDAVTPDVDPSSDLCESGSVIDHSKMSDSFEAIEPSDYLPSDTMECEVRTVESSAVETVPNPAGEEILSSSDAHTDSLAPNIS